MSLITVLSSFLFKRLSFFSCEIATLSLNFCLTILFSLASTSTSFQSGVCLVSLRCCDRPPIFSTLFSLFIPVWCSLILSSIVLPVSPKYFLHQEQLILYTTPHALSILQRVNNLNASYQNGISEQLKPVADKYRLVVIFIRSLSLKAKLLTNPF